MRLDAFLSQNTDYSRKDIQQLIRQGRVLCNGLHVNKGSDKITPTDQITLDGIDISARGPRYFMLHKPQGYVSATTDADHPTVIDLLNEPQKSLLQIAGRLDMDTTGLVLITDDGQWNHAVTSPKKNCFKCYRVTTTDPIDQDYIAAFAQGVILHGEPQPTLPAKLNIIDAHCADLWISEGKYHQVKRMFAAMGNKVTRLHRSQIGEIALPEDLAAGQYRALSAAEIACFL